MPDKMVAILLTTFPSSFSFLVIFFFIQIELKLVPNGAIDNKSELVQIMAWHQMGNKPLSEPMAGLLDAYMRD